jgi:hypothetical protein
MRLALILVAFAAAVPACSRSAQKATAVQVPASEGGSQTPAVAVAGGGAGAVPGRVPGSTGGPGQSNATATAGTSSDAPTVGTPRAFDNLTVFAVASKAQDDIGDITTLDQALAKKTAVVREMGATDNADPAMQASGASVNSLVIDNKGTIPIYVLAGTVVKGGRQDRQIGEDFIIGANQTVPVDAYCVEHGRWTAVRDGVPTQGKFGTMQQLVTSDVRAAGQYKRDQSEVWAKVGKVNATMQKNPASGTLMATLDDRELAAQRAALADKVNGELSRTPNDDVIGFAYAVDGKVRGVRWFVNHKVFELFRPTLVNTAAVDAITARAAAKASGTASTASPPVTAGDVTAFIQSAQASPMTDQRDTPADNTIQFQESAASYSSGVMLKPSSKAGPAHRTPKKVSTDILSK